LLLLQELLILPVLPPTNLVHTTFPFHTATN